MNQEQIIIQSHYDQRKLVGSYYHADDPRCILVLVHGMCEHRLRYHHFLTYLSNRNISCLMFDTRGHGESVHDKDELGYFNDTKGDAIISDLDQIINYAHTLANGLPVLLLGHSMGSLIVRTYFKQYGHKVKALIVCGSPSQNPLVPTALALSKALQLLYGEMHRSNLMQKLIFGTYAKEFTGTLSENSWLTRNKEIVKQYDNDPLCGFTFTLNGFDNLFNLLKRTYSDPVNPLVDLNTPILYLCGSKDPVIVSVKKWEEAINHMRSLGFKRIRAKCYDQARHELLNELNKDEVYADIYQFIDDVLTNLERERNMHA